MVSPNNGHDKPPKQDEWLFVCMKVSRVCVWVVKEGKSAKKEKEKRLEYKVRTGGRMTNREKNHVGPIKDNNPESRCLHYAGINFKSQPLVGRNHAFYFIYLG